MNFRRISLSLVVIAGIIWSGSLYPLPVRAEQVIRIFMDGQEIPSGDQPPVIVNSRTMAPLRVIGEGLGLDVKWDPAGFRVLISSPGWEGQVPSAASPNLKVPGIFIDGKELQPQDADPIILNDRTLLPVRDISEALGREVRWDADNYMVLVMSEPGIPVTAQPEAEPENEPSPGNAAAQPEASANHQSPAQAEEEPGNPVSQPETAVMGDAVASGQQLRALLKANNPEAPDLVDLYLEIGQIYGVRGDIAFCQAAKETGWWKFGGLALPEQNNYCGLGVTGAAATASEDLRGANPQKVYFEEGKHGAFFDCPASGVEAHIQHLYAYATTDALPAARDLLDPRFIKVTRGSAPRWIDLGGKWAVPGYDRNKYGSMAEALNAGETYGHSILKDYYRKAVGETAPSPSTISI